MNDQLREMTEHQMIEYATRMRKERDEALAALRSIKEICEPLIYPYDTPPGIVQIHDTAEAALSD